MAFDFIGMTFSSRDTAQQYESVTTPTWMWQLRSVGSISAPEWVAYYGPMTYILSNSYLRYHTPRKREAVQEANRRNRERWTTPRTWVERMHKRSRRDWVAEIRDEQRHIWSRPGALQDLPTKAREQVIQVLGLSHSNPCHTRRNNPLGWEPLKSKAEARRQAITHAFLAKQPAAIGRQAGKYACLPGVASGTKTAHGWKVLEVVTPKAAAQHMAKLVKE